MGLDVRHVVLAPDLTMLAATNAFVVAAKQSREALIGRAFFDVFPDDNLRASLARVLHTKAPETIKAGAWSLTNTPVLDGDGEVRFIIHSVEDVTALEATTEELEAFGYSIGHDLRAPLRGIQGFSQALLEDYATAVDAKGQGYLQRISKAALKMSEQIDDLLNLSRISRSALSRVRVDLSALARDITRDLQPQHTHRPAVTIADGLDANVDERLARIVFENLLGNAFKFTAKTVSPRVEVGAVAIEGVRTFVVRDNGAGFDEAYASKLFAPFQRMHSEKDFAGRGIGLATVQRIVRRHGGRVWAKAAVNGGATIYFTLPE